MWHAKCNCGGQIRKTKFKETLNNKKMRTQGIRNLMIVSGIIIFLSTATFANNDGGNKFTKQKAEIVKLFNQVKKWVNVFDEAELGIENWMTEMGYLSKTICNAEIELQLEDWMLNSDYLSQNKFVDNIEIELSVESWMTESHYLTQNISELSAEPELELEDWMIDEEFFVPDYAKNEKEAELEFESWMFTNL